MTRISSSPLLALALTAGLSGCGRSGSAAAGPEAGGASTAKLNAYTRAHNTLLSPAGLQVAEEYYLGPGPRALTSEKLGFGLDTLGQVLAQARDELKAARALPEGGMDDADHAADALIASIDRTTAKLSDIDAYYLGKGFQQDGLARGKREDGPIAAVLADADAAMQRFNAVIEADLKRQTAADLERLKAKGDLLNYDVKFSINQARTAMGLFNRPQDVADPARFKQAHQLIASLQPTLADLRTRIEAAKRDKKPEQEAINPNYDGVANALVSLTGDFSQFEKQHSKEAYGAIVNDFNNAVSDANYITL